MKDLKKSKEILKKLELAIELAEKKKGPNKIAAETGLKLPFVRNFIEYPEKFYPYEAIQLEQPEKYDIDGYEQLYRDVYGTKSADSLILPDDYIETVEWLLDPKNSKIPERYCFYLRKYYIEDFKGEELEQFGVITPARINQIIRKGLRLLRNPGRAKYLQYGLEYITEVDKAIEKAKKDIMEKHIKSIEEQRTKRLEEISNNGSINIDRSANFSLFGDITIDELDLSTRSYNALKRKNIKKLSDFENLTIDDLLKMRNLGPKSLEEILAKFRTYGLTLKEE